MLERLSTSPHVCSHCLPVHRPGTRPANIALCIVSIENRLAPVVRLFMNTTLVITLGVKLYMPVGTLGSML